MLNPLITLRYFGQCRLSWWVCCLPWSICNDRELNFLTCGLEVLWQSNCLDRMAFIWQKVVCYSPRMRKAASRIVRFVQISRSWKDFALGKAKFLWTELDRNIEYACQSVAHINLVNNSVWSRKNTMSVALNFGAVRIIWAASKLVHILFLKPLHSQVRSHSSLISIPKGVRLGESWL